MITDVISERSVIVCCGSGGVGKTTMAASIGLAAAALTVFLTLFHDHGEGIVQFLKDLFVAALVRMDHHGGFFEGTLQLRVRGVRAAA